MAVKKNQETKVKMESSFIKMTSYHYGLKRLKVVIENRIRSTINYQQSTVYVFYHVPVEVYQELLTSGSTGRYFNEKIRDRYNCEKA